VAQKLGYKDATVVKNRWHTIKRKKITGAVAAAASPAGVKKAGKSATPKKAKGAAAVAEEGEDGVETPTKAGAKRGRKPKVKEEAE